MASISAYVEQDDIFIGTLKVKEHLKFQVSINISMQYDIFDFIEIIKWNNLIKGNVKNG